jgi:hypothetical protein
VRASRGEIARSLEGNWREELLFVLEQSLELYDLYVLNTFSRLQYAINESSGI